MPLGRPGPPPTVPSCRSVCPSSATVTEDEPVLRERLAAVDRVHEGEALHEFGVLTLPRALVAVGQAVEIEYKSEIMMCKRIPVQQKWVIYVIVVICAGSDPLFVSSAAGTMRYKESQE